jgi:RND family efflux transporter MFP subunit
MKDYIIKSKAWAAAHKKLSITVVIVVLAAGGYSAYSFLSDDEASTQYVVVEAERGTVRTTVSGTGQVSAGNQVELSAKAGGEITYINAKAGQAVAAGQLIAQTDYADDSFALESARISYEKLTNPDDDDVRKAQDSLDSAYASAQATLTSSSAELTGVRDDLDDMLNEGYLSTHHYGLSTTGNEYRQRAQDSFYEADNMLTDFIREYRTFSLALSPEKLAQALRDANAVGKSLAQAAKYAEDAVAYFRDRETNDNDKATADDAYELSTSITASANGTVSGLSSSASSVTDAEDSLRELKDGPDELDLRSEAASLRAKEQAYANHFVRSPFAGTIASVSAKMGDDVSSGATIATVITKDKVAEISLNEIDAAKVAEGQKAELTFDAVDGLAVEGTVSEIDLVGTVSQGVVSYAVKIAFDASDARVKPGMTVSASIVTQSKEGVVAVPSAAVKTVGDGSFVEVIDGVKPSRGAITSDVAPHMVPVEVGLEGDESVEIVSGLAEGEPYVSRTVTATGAAAKPTTSTSLFGGGATRTTGTGGNAQFRAEGATQIR